ncbi:MAG: ACT domain-containing protein [Acidimicrobiia bacterium]
MNLRLARQRRRPRLHLDDDHRTQVAHHRSRAIQLAGADPAVVDRIKTAPPGYLLAHRSSDVVRHCELLDPLAAIGEVRAVATPGRSRGEWHLDLASRDRPGLLAAFTGVLLDAGIDVVQAVLATWDDDAALQALTVHAAQAPELALLQRALATALDAPSSSPPVADAQVRFDHVTSPLYTACDVTVTDRPGLLHAIAVAIAAAGVDIHAARVTTNDGIASDRFDLSDTDGHKLSTAQEAAIRAGIASGITSG